MTCIRTFALLLITGLATTAAAEEKVNYEDHVKPIFRQKCFTCHNSNKKTSGLDLSTYISVMEGGAAGTSIEPGSPDDSYLFMLVNHDIEPAMPPDSDRIADEMLATIRKWIDTGAPETSSSKVMLPKKPAVSLTVDVSADARPEGAPPLPDVLNLSPVVHTEATTAVPALATSPWAKLIAVAGQKQVILYSSDTLQPLGVLPFPEGQARVLKFSRNGALLLAGGGHGASKGLAVVWNVRTGERVFEVGDELDEVLAADISSDQMFVALGGPGKIVRTYHTETGELAYEITKHTDWISSLEFSPDGVLLATADRSGRLHVWEAFTGLEYLTLNGHNGAVNSVSWRIDSNVLASASADASVKLWEVENGKNIKSWNAHGGGTTTVEFCRDGRVVTCGRDKTAKLWDQNGKLLKAFPAFADLALQVSHCDETDRVVAGDWTGEVRVWNAADAKQVGTVSTNPPTLETRLASVEAQLSEHQHKAEAARNAVDAATAAKEAHVQKIEAARNSNAEARRTLSEHQAKLQSRQQELAETQQKITSSTERIAALRNAIPDLQLAAGQAGKAAQALPDNEQLAATAEKLSQQAAARVHEVDQTKAAVIQLAAVVAEINKAVPALTAEVQKSEQHVAASKQAFDELTAALTPYDEKLSAANSQHAAARNAVSHTVADIERWQQYIALRDELAALREQREAHRQLQIGALEAEAELQNLHQQIQAAQQTIATSEKSITDAQQQARNLGAGLTTAEQQRTQQAAVIGKHEQALPALQAAARQIKAAAASLPNDADIAQSAEALAKAAETQSLKLTQLEPTLAETDEKIQQTKIAVSNAKETIAASQDAIKQAQATLQRLTIEVAPAEASVADAKTHLQSAQENLDKAIAVVEARREKMRPQLQVIQAAR